MCSPKMITLSVNASQHKQTNTTHTTSHTPLSSYPRRHGNPTGDILIAHIGCGQIAPGHSPRNCSKTEDAAPGQPGQPGQTGHGREHGHSDRPQQQQSRAGRDGVPPCECSAGGYTYECIKKYIDTQVNTHTQINNWHKPYP